ncbi:MAG: class A beta-lactamase-related serine hydrolase [Clostridia bacterium]|nr:class A beta-lactamase-related serine hydrolase [Clostridia bacterium]
MKKTVKALCVLLAVLMFLVSCGKAQTKPSQKKNEEKTKTEETVKAEEQKPKEEEKPDYFAEYGDILKGMGEVGKSVVCYGELKDEKYSPDIEKLNGILSSYSKNVSVVAYSLDNSKSLCYNTKSGIFAACTVKAAYTLYCLKQMENGKGSLDTQMTYEQKHYETGTGDMQYSAIGTKFNMRTILNKTMSISDNVGYNMAVDYFGRDGYNSWISSLGCSSLQIKPTVWSLHTKAKDLAVIWREIYNYFKTNTEYSKFLYDSCTNTKNNYATASLGGVTYSHKQGNNRTGDWLSYSDAGIVWKENSPYIIVIITDAAGPSAYDAKMMSDVINIIHEIM